MKKAIRLIIKLPTTPFIVAFCLLGIVVFKAVQLFEWIYEVSEYDKLITKYCINDCTRFLKQWFTTV